MQNLTIKQFIGFLRKAEDIDIAPLSFSIKGKDGYYGVSSMSQFGICADVTVNLERVNRPLVEPVVFQRSKRKMAAAAKRKITKSSNR